MITAIPHLEGERASGGGPPALPRGWLVVGLLWGVGLLNYLDRITITTMHRSLVEAIPMTDAQFGLLTSVFLWVYGILSPLVGFLADRFSRSRVIIVSLVVWSLLTTLTGFAKTFEQLLVTRALMGISEACYIPAALAVIADYHRGRTRSLATGVHMTGIFFGSGLGGVGGWLAEKHGWAYAFKLFGGIGVAYALVLIVLLRDPPLPPVAAGVPKAKPVTFVSALMNLLPKPAFIVALVYWGILGLAGWAVTGWMPTYLTEHFHLRQGEGGLSATGYLQGATLIGVLLGGWWADRWSRRTERARIFVPMIGLVAAAPGILLSAHTGVLFVAIAGLVLYGFARSFSDANMMPILCLFVDAKYRATGYGLLNLLSCVVGGAAIYAGGMLRDAHIGVGSIFSFAALVLIVAAGLLAFLRPERASL